MRNRRAKMSLLCASAMLLLIASPVQPYSMGAPDLACKAMKPGHGFDPQEGQPPVDLIIEPEMDVIAPGQKLTITLKATDGQFKGFMVQVRSKLILYLLLITVLCW